MKRIFAGSGQPPMNPPKWDRGLSGMRAGREGSSTPPVVNLAIGLATDANLSLAIAHSLAGSLSLMGWFKYTGAQGGSFGRLLLAWDGTFDSGRCVQLYSGGTTRNEPMLYLPGATPDTLNSLADPAAGTWFHIAVSGLATGGTWTLFFNGVAAGTLTGVALSGINALIAGSNDAGEPFTGALTSLKAGPVAVNAAEVVAEMASRSAIKSGLVAYSLNGPSDLSGFTLNGSATEVAGPDALAA